MVKIACMSDIHNRQKKIVCPEADILVIAGDLTGMGETREIAEFGKWLKDTPYAHKIVVAGNHDWGFQRNKDAARKAIGDGENGVIYLEDSGVEIEGLKFWGSPWQPEFCNWAFNVDYDYMHDWEKSKILKPNQKGPRTDKALQEYWSMIPEDTDVLITHGPPYMMLDKCPDGRAGGSRSLWERVLDVRPELHVFGHIHHSRGVKQFDGITFVNASICDEQYRPFNEVIVIEL